jgi:hypothetical protein
MERTMTGKMLLARLPSSHFHLEVEKATRLKLRNEYLYVSTRERIQTALRIFRDALDDESEEKNRVVSFDFEWAVTTRDQASVNTHVRHRAPAGAMSVMSMASLAYDKVLVLHFNDRAQNSAAIVKDVEAPFLSSPDVMLVGRMIKNDITKFKKDHPNAFTKWVAFLPNTRAISL